MDYKNFLKDEILPVWVDITPDTENGGVFTYFSDRHTPDGDVKSLMSVGRTLWVFSMSYIHVEQRQEYLDICKSIFLFLQKCTLDGGKLPFAVSADGSPSWVTKRTFYAEMYCAMGCAQYYKASEDAAVKEYCELLLDYIYENYLLQQNTCQEEEEDRNSKCFGVHMTALMMAQSVRDSGICIQRADEIASLAISQMRTSGFVDDEKKCVYEHVSLTGEKLTGVIGTSSCTGHVYEASWFVMCEGELLDDDSLRLFGKKLLDYALPVGFEEVCEFIPTGIDTDKSIAENISSGEFEAFPQLEAIIAYRLAYNILGEEKYLEIADRLEASLNSYYKKFDGVMWCGDISVNDGEYVLPPSAGRYRSPFHFERYLLVLDMLKEAPKLQYT